MWMPWGVWIMVVLIIKSTHTHPRNSLELISLISDDEDVLNEENDRQDDNLSELNDTEYDGYTDIMDGHFNELYKRKDPNITTGKGHSYPYKDSYAGISNQFISRADSSISDEDYSYDIMYKSREAIFDYEKSLESTEYEDYFTSMIPEIPISLKVVDNDMENIEIDEVNYDSRKSSRNTEFMKHNEENTLTNMHYDDFSEVMPLTKIHEFSPENNDSEQSYNISYLENLDYYEGSLDNSKSEPNKIEYLDEFEIKDEQKHNIGVSMKSGIRTKRYANDNISDEEEEDNYLAAKDEHVDSSKKLDANIEIKDDISKEGRNSEERNLDGVYHSLEIRGIGIEMGGNFTGESTDDELKDQNKNESEKYKRKSRNFFEEPLDPLAEEIEENKNKKVLGINDDEDNTQESNEVEKNNVTQNSDTSNISTDTNTSLENKTNSKEESQKSEDIFLDDYKIQNDTENKESANIELKNYSVLTALENIPDIEVLEVNTTDSIIRLNSNKELDEKSHIRNENSTSQSVKDLDEKSNIQNKNITSQKVKELHDKPNTHNENNTSQKVKKLDEKPHIQNKNSTPQKVEDLHEKPNTLNENNTSQKVKKNTYIKKVPKSDSKKKKHDEPIDKEKLRIHKGSKYINFVELDKMLEQRDEDEKSLKRTEKSLRDSKSNSSETIEESSPEKRGSDVHKSHRMVVNEKMSGKDSSEKDLTVTYNVNNNKIFSYDINNLYKDNKHFLDAIQNAIKVKDYKRVHLILNIENNTIDLKKRKKKSHKKGKSLKNKEKNILGHKSPKKERKDKKKKQKKPKIKSRQTKEIKYDPYLGQSLTGWRDEYGHPIQSDLGNGINLQKQWPMKFYLPNINTYPVPYANSPSFENTPSLDDNFVAAIDFDQVYSVPTSHDLPSLKDPNSEKLQEGPYDRGKPSFSGANIKDTMHPAPTIPAFYDRRSYGRTIKEDGHKIPENIGEDVDGFWIVPSYNPGQTGYWLYPSNAAKFD